MPGKCHSQCGRCASVILLKAPGSGVLAHSVTFIGWGLLELTGNSLIRLACGVNKQVLILRQSHSGAGSWNLGSHALFWLTWGGVGTHVIVCYLQTFTVLATDDFLFTKTFCVPFYFSTHSFIFVSIFFFLLLPLKCKHFLRIYSWFFSFQLLPVAISLFYYSVQMMLAFITQIQPFIPVPTFNIPL